MKVNPLSENFFSKKIDNSFNIFFFYGNNFGLIDICYSELKKNLKIELENPFLTNYFDENKLFNDTEAFFDELYSIPLFGDKKTTIIDIRQGDRKKDVAKMFNNLDFSTIKDTNLIILSYMFKQNDQLTKKILNTQNAISFSCYEENEFNINKKFQNILRSLNLKLNDHQIHELTTKLSKDSKIIHNTFEKIRLNNNGKIDFNVLLNLIDDNNDKTIYEMINKLMTGNYYESINLLKKFEQLNTTTISIIYLIKLKLKLLEKCLKMRRNGLTKRDILNDRSLNIFYSEHSTFLNMLDLWNLNKINLCLYYLFKTELNCKSKKNFEYMFLSQLFMYIYYKIKN